MANLGITIKVMLVKQKAENESLRSQMMTITCDTDVQRLQAASDHHTVVQLDWQEYEIQSDLLWHPWEPTVPAVKVFHETVQQIYQHFRRSPQKVDKLDSIHKILDVPVSKGCYIILNICQWVYQFCTV